MSRRNSETTWQFQPRLIRHGNHVKGAEKDSDKAKCSCDIGRRGWDVEEQEGRRNH